MKIDIFTDSFGIEMVTIDNENGTFTSMLKSTYDEMIAQQEENK
jgi:DNA/RNA endonuclease YhcR with UshA esterase domain